MKNLLIILFVIVVFGCNSNEVVSIEDIIDINSIYKVEMTNNSGNFELSDEQINQFKKDLLLLKHEPDLSIKVGGITITVYGEDEQYIISGKTHGNNVELNLYYLNSGDSKTYVFSCDGINFDNYKPE